MNKVHTNTRHKIATHMLSAVVVILLSSVLSLLTACLDSSSDNNSQPKKIVQVINGYKYETLDDQTYNLIGYEGTQTELTIPSNINGIIVTSIEKEALKNHSELTKLHIPETVKSIGTSCLQGCTSLRSLTIPYAVTLGRLFAESTSSNYAASNVPQTLTELTLLSSCTRIPTEAFTDCVSLKKIYIPASVTTIEDGSDSVFIGVNGHTPRDNITLRPFYGCSPELEIFCEHESAPEGWKHFWNYTDRTTILKVYWNKSTFN